jgi:hypothetical protein
MDPYDKAIDDLKCQRIPNIAQTAKKYNLNRSTLSRRFAGKTVSRQISTSEYHKLLTDTQEEVLLDYLNKLTIRGLPPTPRMVENLVFDIAKVVPGSKWVDRFCNRHQDRITSRYLRSIDNSRYVADNSEHFAEFYREVCLLLLTYTL